MRLTKPCGQRGDAALEAIRERQFYYQCGTTMIAIEDYFSQHEQGLLGEEQFSRGCATSRTALTEPGLRAFWLKPKGTLATATPHYCASIDSLCTGETAAFDDRA